MLFPSLPAYTRSLAGPLAAHVVGDLYFRRDSEQ